MNLVVGQITNLGDVHKFCIFLRFEGRNDEKCTEVTINMHFENTKIKTWKKNTPTHTPSLPQMVCTLAQIYPNCAIHWLERVTKKSLSATPFGALIFLNMIWCKMVFIPKKTVTLSLSFLNAKFHAFCFLRFFSRLPPTSYFAEIPSTASVILLYNYQRKLGSNTSELRMTFTWCNWLWWRVVDHITIHNVPIHHKRIRSYEIDLEEGW